MSTVQPALRARPVSAAMPRRRSAYPSKPSARQNRVTVAGEVPLRSQHDAAKQDIAYVPRERGRDSLFRWMSIRENFAIATIGRDTSGGWLMPRRSTKRLSKYVKSLGIVLGDQGDAITTLSGGNQQKVIIGRWLASEPRILLLNDPTRGIDIGAKSPAEIAISILAEITGILRQPPR